MDPGAHSDQVSAPGELFHQQFIYQASYDHEGSEDKENEAESLVAVEPDGARFTIKGNTGENSHKSSCGSNNAVEPHVNVPELLQVPGGGDLNDEEGAPADV